MIAERGVGLGRDRRPHPDYPMPFCNLHVWGLQVADWYSMGLFRAPYFRVIRRSTYLLIPAGNLLVALALVLTQGCERRQTDPTQVSDAGHGDEASIRRQVDRAVAALNTADVETLVELRTDDAVILKPGGLPERGKDEIRTNLETLFEGWRVTESRTIEEIRFTDDWAFVWGFYEVVLTPTGKGESVQEKGKYIDILRRESDGEWRFARTIWNVDPPD